MAVIKCKNCENEILDTEIVCPYCDFPIAAKKENDTPSAPVDPAMSGETIKIATSRDFEKEKEAFLKSINDNGDTDAAPEDLQEDDEAQRTVKFSSKDIPHKQQPPQRYTATRGGERKPSPRTAYYQRQAQKRKRRAMIITVTVGVLIIAGLIWLISGMFSCTGKNSNNEEVQTSASSALTTNDVGYEYEDYTLTITDADCLDDYTASDRDSKPWKSVGTVKHIVIKSGIVSIGEYSFEGMKSVETVTIPSSVADIKNSAFYECVSLEEIIFDDDLTELRIRENAFAKCASLKSVEFPEDVSSIHEKAFSECSNLEKVKIYGDRTAVGEKAFSNCDSDLVIYCQKDSYAYEYAKDEDIEIQLIDSDGKLVDDEDEEDEDKKDDDKKDDDKKDNDKKDNDKKDNDKKDDDKKDNDKNDEKKDDTDKPSTNTQTPSGQTTPAPEGGTTTAPEGNNDGGITDEAKLNDLYNRLNNAKTPEEEAAIWDEIAKITG